MCKTESISGLHVRDYKSLSVDALEEMIKLDEQLGEHLRKMYDFLQEEDYFRLKYNLECLITDNDAHRDYCVQCQGDVLQDMYESQTSDDLRRGTPCDYPDNDGHYSCPFDANAGDDCRNFCGLGVDE